MKFFLQRAKAIAASAAALGVPILIPVIEKSIGFDIPTTWEAALLVAVTGGAVYRVPNSK
jgi:hypothetical protein